MNPDLFQCPTNDDFVDMDANRDGNLTVEEYINYAIAPPPM